MLSIFIRSIVRLCLYINYIRKTNKTIIHHYRMWQKTIFSRICRTLYKCTVYNGIFFHNNYYLPFYSLKNEKKKRFGLHLRNTFSSSPFYDFAILLLFFFNLHAQEVCVIHSFGLHYPFSPEYNTQFWNISNFIRLVGFCVCVRTPNIPTTTWTNKISATKITFAIWIA